MCDAVSATLTVKKNCPVAVGVPLNVPLAARLSPGGRYVNGASVHVSMPVPPPAVKVFVYAVATLPSARVKFPSMEIVVRSSVNCRTAKFALFDGSVARMRNVYVPAVVGVPLSSPSPESVRPGGSDPPSTDHTYDNRQHALKYVENGDPTVIGKYVAPDIVIDAPPAPSMPRYCVHSSVCPSASVNCRPTLKYPLSSGVPLT